MLPTSTLSQFLIVLLQGSVQVQFVSKYSHEPVQFLNFTVEYEEVEEQQKTYVTNNFGLAEIEVLSSNVTIIVFEQPEFSAFYQEFDTASNIQVQLLPFLELKLWLMSKGSPIWGALITITSEGSHQVTDQGGFAIFGATFEHRFGECQEVPLSVMVNKQHTISNVRLCLYELQSEAIIEVDDIDYVVSFQANGVFEEIIQLDSATISQNGNVAQLRSSPTGIDTFYLSKIAFIENESIQFSAYKQNFEDANHVFDNIHVDFVQLTMYPVLGIKLQSFTKQQGSTQGSDIYAENVRIRVKSLYWNQSLSRKLDSDKNGLAFAYLPRKEINQEGETTVQISTIDDELYEELEAIDATSSEAKINQELFVISKPRIVLYFHYKEVQFVDDLNVTICWNQNCTMNTTQISINGQVNFNLIEIKQNYSVSVSDSKYRFDDFDTIILDDEYEKTFYMEELYGAFIEFVDSDRQHVDVNVSLSYIIYGEQNQEIITRTENNATEGGVIFISGKSFRGTVRITIKRNALYSSSSYVVKIAAPVPYSEITLTFKNTISMSLTIDLQESGRCIDTKITVYDNHNYYWHIETLSTAAEMVCTCTNASDMATSATIICYFDGEDDARPLKATVYDVEVIVAGYGFQSQSVDFTQTKTHIIQYLIKRQNMTGEYVFFAVAAVLFGSLVVVVVVTSWKKQLQDDEKQILYDV